MDLQVCLIECDHVSEITVKTVRLFHQHHAAVTVFPEVRQHRIKSRPSRRLGSLNVGELLNAQVLFGAVSAQQLLLSGNAIPQFLLFARYARIEDRFAARRRSPILPGARQAPHWAWPLPPRVALFYEASYE